MELDCGVVKYMKDTNKAFHIACNSGHASIAHVLIEKSAELKIDLNGQIFRRTVFHFACEKGNFNIAELLVQKSAEFNIDLNIRSGYLNCTAFQLAC